MLLRAINNQTISQVKLAMAACLSAGAFYVDSRRMPVISMSYSVIRSDNSSVSSSHCHHCDPNHTTTTQRQGEVSLTSMLPLVGERVAASLSQRRGLLDDIVLGCVTLGTRHCICLRQSTVDSQLGMDRVDYFQLSGADRRLTIMKTFENASQDPAEASHTSCCVP